MELHVGALRDANQHGVKTAGEAKGMMVGDAPTALPLSHFLNALEERGELPKTILFNLNEQDNTVLSALTGTFHEAGVPGKMQFGTAWWFQDHKDGMEKQLHTLPTTACWAFHRHAYRQPELFVVYAARIFPPDLL
ncbi:MAG: glucuronate isomerase [Christensenellales bacterium]